MKTIEMTLDAYREGRAERERMLTALQAIAGWGEVNLSAEPESELRKVIESMVGCAVAGLGDAVSDNYKSPGPPGWEGGFAPNH